MINEGDIWLSIIPQVDNQIKKRPVLVLKQMPNNDFIVCAISSQLRHKIDDFDEVLNSSADNGLKTVSLIRLSSLNTLAIHQLYGKIGKISAELHHKLLTRISNHLSNKK
jgi:mRNA interferase MazF